jgi:hypothetical protein
MISTSEGLSKERTPNSAALFKEFLTGINPRGSPQPPKTGPPHGGLFFRS